ncbi:MAG: alanine dehydrogenase [Hyphomonas sp.]|nr:alanine dehydrogenase [Hyphomonas sp.]
MIIGTVKEIKSHEYRVGLTPESAAELSKSGHRVLVETGAGLGIGASNEQYVSAGAEVLGTAGEVFSSAEMIVKVKEPQKEERARLRPDQILFTYLHLAPDPQQAEDLVASNAVCIAYETVTDDASALPLLKPMSQVAGRLAIQAGASALEKVHGGRGVLLGGVPGVPPARVTIIGGGVVGLNAAQMAVGLGADVTIFDRNVDVLERLNLHFGSLAKTCFASATAIAQALESSDLVIGAVLIPGAAAPKLVSRSDLRSMKAGSVLVDVAIDQGGCFETSRPTTHDAPTFVEEGIVHYCVANMPGAVARTSAYALNNVTLPFVARLANLGWKAALKADHHLANGLNVCRGHITNGAVAKALGASFVEPANQL